MNIYQYEFRKYLKSMLIWTFSMVAVLFFYLVLFPNFAKEASQLEKMMAQLPEALTKAFGMSNMNLSNIGGFYSFIFTYIILIGSIFATKLGIDITSKEAREKTSDFLLVKPRTRAAILTPKLLTAFTHIIIMNVIYIAFAYLGMEIFKNEDYNREVFFLITLSMLFIQFFLMMLGFLLGTIVKRLKSVLPLALGVVFGLFVINLMNQTLEDAKYSYLTPFGHFENSYITENLAYSTPHLLVSIGATVLFIIASYVIYLKKDVASV